MMQPQQQKQEDATIELLQTLSTEISRDGGASLVVSLKDYVKHPKRIDDLVKKSTGKTKLLTFLERHPTVFDVNRHEVPHFVKLRDYQYVSCCYRNDTDDSTTLQALYDKIGYVLTRRQSRLTRRQGSNDRKEVNLIWLLKECTTQVHYYLRAGNFYAELYQTDVDLVKVVGSVEWQELVLPAFEQVVQQTCSVNNGKVCLLSGPEENNDDDIHELTHKLQQLVDRDGATQVSLSLLLHRNHDLKRLLRGRDFMTLVKQHPDILLQSVQIQVDGTDILLKSKTLRQNGRMEVDETGLFSVTSGKWGSAMTNILSWCCQQVHWGRPPEEQTVIDLTASVGGMTLALAKNFARVIAVEIDSHRAALCQENMIRHGVDNKVEVINRDAMELIPQLRQNCAVMVFVDPPWGGINYKRERRQVLTMGQWTLEEVLQQLAKHLSPGMVGVRLPVNFDLECFLGGLTGIDMVQVRKLGPQLLVVLSF
jgi:16S rRNA G966 N2-methylase RsmD